MARDKKSLFDWLTGGAAPESDFSYDDLESGGSGSQNTSLPRHLERSSPDRHVVHSEPEVEPEGELAVDVYQTPTHLIIKAMIAGVRPEDLDVSITRDMVTIRGKRERHVEGTAGDFFFQELYWGAFTRTIVLPQEVEIEEAEANEKHGLLTIRLPKLDKGRHAKLKVKSN
ncbi:MAG: heat shock protein Hsp20, family protein [Candidatus Adlerbacteria bacterium]|nr:heat shock protein Hsp20, family protein [Candidatus Adlerbacteria bacterium]